MLPNGLVALARVGTEVQQQCLEECRPLREEDRDGCQGSCLSGGDTQSLDETARRKGLVDNQRQRGLRRRGGWWAVIERVVKQCGVMLALEQIEPVRPAVEVRFDAGTGQLPGFVDLDRIGSAGGAIQRPVEDGEDQPVDCDLRQRGCQRDPLNAACLAQRVANPHETPSTRKVQNRDPWIGQQVKGSHAYPPPTGDSLTVFIPLRLDCRPVPPQGSISHTALQPSLARPSTLAAAAAGEEDAASNLLAVPPSASHHRPTSRSVEPNGRKSAPPAGLLAPRQAPRAPSLARPGTRNLRCGAAEPRSPTAHRIA